MGGSNENVISQLREKSSEELLKTRKSLLRNLKIYRYAILTGVVAVVVAIIVHGLVERADRLAHPAESGVLFAVTALVAIAGVSSRTKIWFIDLILSEKTPSSDNAAGGGVKQ